MQIELIGCTGAGKSTLLRMLLAGSREKGKVAFSGEEFILEKVHLNRITYPLFRTIVIDIISFTVCLFLWGKYYKFYDIILKCVREIPATEGWFNKLNIARNAIKKIAVYEIARRYGHEKYIFIDEGTVHAVHNFFVHASGLSSLKYFNDFIQMVPHPDMLIYLKRDEDILIERTLKRGHKRIPGNSPERVRFFVEQAIAIFRKIEREPQFSEKLIKISGDGKIENSIPENNNNSISFIIEIIQDIYNKKLRNKTEHMA